MVTGASSEMSGFLALLEPSEIDSLRSRARRVRFGRGETLLNEGEATDRVVVLLSGRAKVSYFTAEGKEVVLAIRDAGDLIGELSWIDREPASATVTAVEECDALIVADKDFERFLADTPRAALVLLEMVVHRLRDADRKRIEFAAYDTTGRVARRLLELADRFGTDSEAGVSVRLPISQEELASWTGSSREAVAKSLRELRDKGLIETRRKGVTILDPDGLADRSV